MLYDFLCAYSVYKVDVVFKKFSAFCSSDLEGAVEELREDVISRQCRVNMCDVEGMALMLSTVTKTFGELKGLSAAIFTTSHNQGRSLFKLLLLRVFFSL